MPHLPDLVWQVNPQVSLVVAPCRLLSVRRTCEQLLRRVVQYCGAPSPLLCWQILLIWANGPHGSPSGQLDKSKDLTGSVWVHEDSFLATFCSVPGACCASSPKAVAERGGAHGWGSTVTIGVTWPAATLRCLGDSLGPVLLPPHR